MIDPERKSVVDNIPRLFRCLKKNRNDIREEPMARGRRDVRAFRIVAVDVRDLRNWIN